MKDLLKLNSENTDTSVATSVRNWRELDGVVYVKVSDLVIPANDRPKWLRQKGYTVSEEAEFLMKTRTFEICQNSVGEREIAIVKGCLFPDVFKGRGRTFFGLSGNPEPDIKHPFARTSEFVFKKAREEMGFHNSTPRILYLLRNTLTNEDMNELNLSVIVNSGPLISKPSEKNRFLAVCNVPYEYDVEAVCGNSDTYWNRTTGFAFEVSKH